MDVLKVLVELRAYRVRLDESIAVLDSLARRRGETTGDEVPPAVNGSVPAKSPDRKLVRRKRKPS